MNKVWVVIPAAGVGKRMQTDIPKQYLRLHGRTVIEHTLDCFMHHSDIAGIIVVLHPNDPYWSERSAEIIATSPVPLYTVDGGKERADSVLNALSYLKNISSANDHVLVHDAARPCLSRKDLDLLIQQGYKAEKQGAILAMPVRDTMKREEAGHITHTVQRTGLWHALTPQMFQINVLYKALEAALHDKKEVTDEASAMEIMGLHPQLVEGDASNIKITHPTDLQLAAFFLQQKKEGEE